MYFHPRTRSHIERSVTRPYPSLQFRLATLPMLVSVPREPSVRYFYEEGEFLLYSGRNSYASASARVPPGCDGEDHTKLFVVGGKRRNESLAAHDRAANLMHARVVFKRNAGRLRDREGTFSRKLVRVEKDFLRCGRKDLNARQYNCSVHGSRDAPPSDLSELAQACREVYP
jgi:hypothetical protein